MAGEPPGEQPRDHERDTREDRPGRALRRDVNHEGEQTEEQQGGAEVVLENNDAQREEPHHHDGTQIAGSVELEPEDAPAGQRQQVAFLVEIGREGQGQEDLGHLGGLKTERAEPNPDSRTVEFATDPRHERQQQQHHACQEQQVGETLEPAVIAQPDHDSGEQQDTEPRPEQLVRGGVCVLGVVEARDHGQPEPVEQENDGQDHRVRVGNTPPDDEVCSQCHAEPDEGARYQVVRGCAPQAQVGDNPPHHAERARDEGQYQLHATSLPVDDVLARCRGLLHDRHQQASGSASSAAVGLIGASSVG